MIPRLSGWVQCMSDRAFLVRLSIRISLSLTVRKNLLPGKKSKIFEGLLAWGKRSHPGSSSIMAESFIIMRRYADGIKVLERFLADQGGWLGKQYRGLSFHCLLPVSFRPG